MKKYRNSFIALFLLCGITNLFAQAVMPPINTGCKKWKTHCVNKRVCDNHTQNGSKSQSCHVEQHQCQRVCADS